MIRPLISLLLVLLLGAFSFSTAEESPRPSAILFSAQSQGALFSCRCPYNPEGGFARRATVIAQLRKKYSLTVVEAGGWMPGGVYDEFAGGRKEIVKRANLISTLLSKLKYDVVAIGEDDLNSGLDSVLKLRDNYLSGNLQPPKYSSSLQESVTKNGICFINLFGANFPSSLYPQGRRLSASNHINFLQTKVRIAKANGAKRIVLISQMTERETISTLKKVEEIDAVFIAHRTASGRFPYKVNNTLVFGLAPLGRAVGLWTLKEGFRQIRLGMNLEPDSNISSIIQAAGYEGDKLEKVSLDLYFMSRCPFGRKALGKMLEIRKKMGNRADLNLYFILNGDKKGRLSSLHGEDELEDDRRMLAIWLNDKTKLASYLKESEKADFDYAKWMKSEGIDPWRVKAAFESGEIESELQYHAKRCDLLGISASPTLIIGGEAYEGDFSKISQILFSICNRLKSRSKIPACSDIPKCFSDSDCYKFGYVSYCENPGKKNAKCVHIKEAPILVKVIRADNAISDPYEAALVGMKRWLPSMETEVLAESLPEAIELIKTHKITWLPAFVFPASIEKCRNFKKLKESFRKSGQNYIAMPRTYFANTKLSQKCISGKTKVFISPFSRNSLQIVKRLSIMNGDGFAIPQIHFKAFKRENGELFSVYGIGDLEESARMIAALSIDPAKGWKYIESRYKNIGSSYWDDAAKEAGIEPSVLKAAALSKATKDRLLTDAKECGIFSTDADSFIIFNNREIAVPKDAFDFEVLMWIAKP